MTDENHSQPSPDGAPGPTPAFTDHLELVKESEGVKQALLARPKLGLRTQLLIGFLVVFLFAAGIAATILYSIYKVESRIQSVEIVKDYVFEIDKARRFEKNYFLYNTNLTDAVEAVYKAKALAEGSKEELSRVIGVWEWRGIMDNIKGYEQLLDLLAELEKKKRDAGHDAQKKELELRVRRQGQKMIRFAQDVMRKEKASISAAIAGQRRLQSYSLAFLLIFLITTALLISGNIVRSIVRFESYTQRIAAGDFTPITPTRRYRDEFTNLGLAINHMMLELQKHEAMLIQAHKLRAIGTLTAGVAHELNNPLNNITITSHMMLEDYDEISDEERQEMVGDVAKEADRAKRIVANLLDFTRESETKLEPLDLVQLVKDTLDLAANQIKIAGIKAEFNAIDNPPRILGDSQQLRQVFLNLILNAVQASERGGKIQLLVHPSDEPNNLSVKVIDYGTGIPKHILTRIFDPFFTTKEAGKGTGLGLSVSQGIVAKHGGRMLVDSQEGRGTSFTVILPVATIS